MKNISNKEDFEIERKYLIEYPEKGILAKCEYAEIIQTYLISKPDTTLRVRKIAKAGSTEYITTQKKRISGIKCIEKETRISLDEYNICLQNADPASRPIEKTRYYLNYENQLFEIDIYPFWDKQAVMEIELEDENQPVSLPDFISIIKEVTDDKQYKNAAIARKIPEQESDIHDN